ncbi:HNH endonuclease signature motif containing protein, partial [Vibrio atlanticus]|uniref:HNH endonuclease signature motif containing protein n=1 Tax=Vibrio atlanticus TaxID=693153 RepID=UPI003550923D
IDEPENFQSFIKNRGGKKRKDLISVSNKIPYYYHRYNRFGFNVHEIKNKALSVSESETMKEVYADYTSPAIVSYRKKLFGHVKICPYCSLGETEHLDHYLPKSLFSEYALYTSNLIPCCYKCNSEYKKTEYKISDQRVYFHPFIDKINDFELVKVSLRWVGNNLVINYSISNGSGISSPLYLVLKKHFSSLGLRIRYLTFATSYIEDMNPRFMEDYGVEKDQNKFIAAIDFRYRDSIHSCGINHWQTALLKALKNDDKFTSGGFLNM